MTTNFKIPPQTSEDASPKYPLGLSSINIFVKNFGYVSLEFQFVENSSRVELIWYVIALVHGASGDASPKSEGHFSIFYVVRK